MNDLLKRLKKSSTLEAKYLEEKFAEKRDMVKTHVPAFNYMMSGTYDGGYYSGLTIAAAPSKHFKTMLLVLAMKEYLDSHPEGIAVFYDSENGASKSTFDAFDVDTSRILIKDIMNIEELKFDIMSLLENDISKGERVFIGIDSIGNLASKKEIEDALKESGAADMTRAKQLKSLFRMCTPYLGKYDIPMFAVNHVYNEIGLYPKTIMGGGQGPMLAADTVLFVGKSVNKDGKEIEGYNFNLLAHKSRFIREGTKIPLTVSFEGGIDMCSGLLDMGLLTGTIEKRGNRYARIFRDPETGEIIEDDDIRFKKHFDKAWFDEVADPTRSEFYEKTREYFSLGSSKMFGETEYENDLDESEDDEAGETPVKSTGPDENDVLKSMMKG